MKLAKGARVVFTKDIYVQDGIQNVVDDTANLVAIPKYKKIVDVGETGVVYDITQHKKLGTVMHVECDSQPRKVLAYEGEIEAAHE